METIVRLRRASLSSGLTPMSTELTSPPKVVRTDSPAIAELRSVSKTFNVGRGRELKVLDQIDLAIHERALLALLGQSGSGKSTLLPCLTRLTKPTSRPD